MKRIIAFITSVILLFSLFLSLCACGDQNESSDVIYSLYYYFKEDTNDILKILSSDNLSEQEKELKEKIVETNWVVSALLTSLDELQDDTSITTAGKEDAKENINGITSLIDENLSDLCNNDGSSALVGQFNKTLLANMKYVIELRFQILDISILNNMSSQNLISLEDINTKCVCEIRDYITIN